MAFLRIVLVPVIVWLIYLLKGNIWLRLYPAVMVGVALSVFAISLFRVPVVERIARKMGEKLDEKGVSYCRTVTKVWTVFLAVHLAFTVATAFASHEIWAFYNGFLSYVMMALLFAGEWIVLRRVRHG